MFKLRSAKVSLLALTGLLVMGIAFAIPPGTDEQIRERLQPFGDLCKAGEECGSTTAAASTGPLSGEEVYNKFCFACHAAGVGGAPLFADSAQWAPRIDKGIETLYANTVSGINTMPAKGTCMSCSEDELKASVDYMLSKIP